MSKALLFPAGKGAIADVVAGPAAADVDAYRKSLGARVLADIARTNEEAVENVQLRRSVGGLQARKRAIGADEKGWGEWAPVRDGR